MSYFLTANYPPDYSAFISRPMDWEKVSKTLKKRNYNTFGDVIDDLRLIFVNAEKYNARLKGTDTVSGRAYDSAKIMSTKLETAINKMMVTVSDRVERERIDHKNAEREIEASERAEAARIRAQWKNSEGGAGDENNRGATGDNPLKVEGSLRVRNSRKSDTDFEVPFFEEDLEGGQHEESYVEAMKQQKATFERQREERIAMRKATKAIGLAVFERRRQSALAKEWVASEQTRLGIVPKNTPDTTAKNEPLSAAKDSRNQNIPSNVSSKLEEKDRAPVKLKLLKKGIQKTKKKKGKALQQIAMDWGDDNDE